MRNRPTQSRRRVTAIGPARVIEQPPPVRNKSEAEENVRTFETQLAKLVAPYHPAHFAGEVALRFRRMDTDPRLSATTPPHQLIHAIEANCAYSQPFARGTLTSTRLETLGLFMNSFDDPAMTHCVAGESDFFELLCYMHRTQMEKQGELWTVPVGRPCLLFADPEAAPITHACFSEHYGLSPRQWLQLAFTFYAATALLHGRIGFDRSYLEQLPEAGFPLAAAEAFLREVARTPADFGAMYRAVRCGDERVPAASPLTWVQRRPSLQRHPIMRFHDGKFGVPAPALLLHLFASGLFDRISELRDEEVTEEIGKRFEWYTRELWRHHLPDLRVWWRGELAVEGGGKHCDIAVELPDALLLIECKAITEDRKLVTRSAMLTTGAIPEIIDGYIQVIETAARIRTGGYPNIRISLDKPIVGIVTTLGHIPGANHDAVLTTALPAFSARGISLSRVDELLKFRPQTFSVEAVEYLVMLLRAGGNLVPLFDEKCKCSIWQLGDWPTFLNKKASGGRKHDLAFWRNARDELMLDLAGR